MFISTRDLKDSVGGKAALRGWLASMQDRGRIVFISLRDGDGIAQLVCERDRLGEGLFSTIAALSPETPLEATGTVSDPGGGRRPELLVEGLSFLPSEPGFPITRKEHGPDFLMDERHLWLRSARQASILRVRSSLEFACDAFLHGEGFHRFDSPLITPTCCEGTTELFELDFFGERAYLSQSAQLYSEAGIAALGKVYSLGPCFRAEKSKTRRHLAEFWGVEPEMAFTTAEESIAFQERFLRAILERVSEERAEDLISLGRRPEELRFGPGPFPVLEYEEVARMLAGTERPLAFGDDLRVEQEEELSARFSTPFFIYKYPAKCRAFYIEPDPARPELALSSDCLMPGVGEIITGGQRASDYGLLSRRIEEYGLRLTDFKWYLDLRRWGSTPHSGFGMGIERMVRWICGIHHIREAIPFARTMSRFAP